eukprot:CAMPEP_0197259816 /NCGR_PEP_ID=MMETSP1429-20130617/83714_1 /TAXON_ID=49237 /ORGANISM="Chaetoceros  sp., Strain UNC1202" /LENGTH=300 /DNA_ID=CAMNT_0042724035 /DNA_START=962 /DNA_END=1864 /DNA_ORIENTATION=-
MFPCERHVFMYDGGIDSVSRGLRVSNDTGTNTNHGRKRKFMEGEDTMNGSLLMPRRVTATTPMAQLTAITPVSKFDVLKAKLSHDRAGIIEAWMSSVDAFLKLKHAEKKTGYIPFVCRLGFLMAQVGKLGNGTADLSELALVNLLQYMTGSRSRAMKEGVVENARNALVSVQDAELDEQAKALGNLSVVEREVIEECAFAHRGILIENKTLMDTVQPKADWSLKAAKKLTSCACCMPGEGDEDSDDEDAVGSGDENGASASKKQSRKSKSFSTTFTTGPSSGYVDGKTTFAFDPSKFTGM